MRKPESKAADFTRQRILEFLGGQNPDHLTCVSLSNSRGAKDLDCVVKPARDVDYFIEYEKDFSRSLLDRDHLLLDIDIEYTNYDFPAEPYLDRMRAFRLQQPVFLAVRSVLARYGIRPLCLMTGRGYHFVWQIRKSSRAFSRLLHAGRLSKELKHRYNTLKTPIPSAVGRAFAGAGMIMEYLMHEIRRQAADAEIPVQIMEVYRGPQQRGKEIISLDISEYADPLDTRFIRVPFSIYLKPYWKPGVMTPQTRDRIPLIVVAPVTGTDYRSAVMASQSLSQMQHCARIMSTVIPDMSAATELVTREYENSALRRYHDYFYRQQHEPRENWPDTYDRLPLDFLPRCVRRILEEPNELLLVPKAIRLLTAILLATSWHPRHIAGLIRSKYERDYGWLNEWYVYDAGTRADFYTRVFSGLIELKQDRLEDLNCQSLKRAGLCIEPGGRCRTDIFTDFLSQREVFA